MRFQGFLNMNINQKGKKIFNSNEKRQRYVSSDKN
ncbi:MAG: hypothetical protein ACI88A_003315, partial [Paraglaciecola sp.]